MREIRLRAYDKRTEEIIELLGFKYVGTKQVQLFYLDSDGDNTSCTCDRDHIEILRFTELYDESDCLLDEEAEAKPVFESDIVLISYKDKSVIAKVAFDMGMFVLLSDEFPDNYIPIFEIANIDRDYEWINGVVIGNVYQNPGLLEESRKMDE